LSDIQQRTERGDLGVVDENIYPTESGDGCGHNSVDVRGCCDIRYDRQRSAAKPRDRIAGSVQLCLGSPDDGDGSTFLGEGVRNALANSLTGAGDDRNPVLQCIQAVSLKAVCSTLPAAFLGSSAQNRTSRGTL